jgi:hypothetical protein
MKELKDWPFDPLGGPGPEPLGGGEGPGGPKPG